MRTDGSHKARSGDMMTDQVVPALQIASLSKTFSATVALNNVDLAVNRGRVLALLGPNGSGKSTLIRVLAGFYKPDDGARAWVDGESLDLGSAESAKARGLRFVHQDLGLIRELSVVDNVALTTGYHRSRTGRVLQRTQIANTEALLARFGIRLDVRAPLTGTSAVEQTCIAIARAMWDWGDGRRILVLDEPTAALPSREVARLFQVIREVRDRGHAVIYVSHRMDEVFEIADDVAVLRNGRLVGSGAVGEFTARDLVALIAGRFLSTVRDSPHAVGPEPTDPTAVLRVRGLRSRSLSGIDLHLQRGEILGVAGLVGSGREELPYVLAGAAPSSCIGRWSVNGKEVDPGPKNLSSEELGIAFVPAERDREGLIAEFSVTENLTLSALPTLRGRGGMLAKHRETREARRWLHDIGIDAETAERPITSLSGGNRQRVLLARCLYTNPRILVLAEPTAGVDVAARRALYALLEEKAAAGLSILICSSDVEDLVSLCHRVLVLERGRIRCELRRPSISADDILSETEGVTA
ncbi:MAG: sugar transporter ATP-binding protein [Acidimicrobiales bacterium]|jgi:ribose transport system ATP-binding protein|nr:sugar transporter ATP-binding protein [Acidimicrobiales bacterium]